jgi:hypothetical protein
MAAGGRWGVALSGAQATAGAHSKVHTFCHHRECSAVGKRPLVTWLPFLPLALHRDLLLKRDSVTTLERRLYAQRLVRSGGEAAELPPAALTAPLRLAAAERRQVTSELDASLAAGDLPRYQRLAEQLYCDGIISAAELGSCLSAAAAAAAEEEAAGSLANTTGGAAGGLHWARERVCCCPTSQRAR